ncbi:hypothetical protein [Edaphovirga cremea]|uniref:hypothetical protein n=1 Tax=Edaphovirga cremea TaxID=2267246 RepID=UPI001473752B|nr:hypothetical protein [Edaphovirga cremea]
MSQQQGIHREILFDGSIKHVLVLDAQGNEIVMDAKDYISEGIQPPLEDLLEVPTDD